MCLPVGDYDHEYYHVFLCSRLSARQCASVFIHVTYIIFLCTYYFSFCVFFVYSLPFVTVRFCYVVLEIFIATVCLSHTSIFLCISYLWMRKVLRMTCELHFGSGIILRSC